MIRFFLVFIGSLLFFGSSSAQEKTRHQLGLNQGMVFLPQTIEEEGGVVEKVPGFVNYLGLTYKLQLNHKWSLAGETVVELARYVINDSEDEFLKRDNANVISAMGQYEIGSNIEIMAGTGIEIERSRNLFVMRAGIEADLYVVNDWWIVPEIVFEYKQVYYNISLGFKIMKGFGKKLDHKEH